LNSVFHLTETCGKDDGGIFYEFRRSDEGGECALAFGTSCDEELLYPFPLSGTSSIEFKDGQRVVGRTILQNVAADEVYEGAGYVRNTFEEGTLIDLDDANVENGISLHLVIDQGLRNNNFQAEQSVSSSRTCTDDDGNNGAPRLHSPSIAFVLGVLALLNC